MSISSGTFLCPPYSASATASATVNYATCSIGLCGGDTVTMGVCNNGGSFTGGVHICYFSFLPYMYGGSLFSDYEAFFKSVCAVVIEE